jgi:hypothetical protein
VERTSPFDSDDAKQRCRLLYEVLSARFNNEGVLGDTVVALNRVAGTL